MKRNLLLLVVFISILYGNLTAQEIKLQVYGSIEKAYLLQIEGEKTNLVDSINSINSEYGYSLKNFNIGIYRLQFDHKRWLDFLFDNENIEFLSSYDEFIDSLRIIKSESNKLYYKFLKLNKDYKTKTELLTVILTHYPKDDEFYSITNSKLKSIKEEYNNFVNVESQENPQSFIARYIQSSQLPVIPDSIEIENQLNYLKSHSLDHVDFDDADLIYSDAFTNKTIEYLTYYRNPQLPKELLEKEFMKAVDTLLNKAKINVLVYQHITEYLIDGFKKFGFDKIIDYIIENYVIEDDLCLDEETENSIQKRIDQSKLLSIGTKAPNIIMPDINDEIIDLSEIKSDKTLLVFYSSQCPHCQILLPQLNEFQKQQKDLKIIAISLDNEQDEWIKFVNDNKLDLININDPNGWDGHLASEFYIYATPTMFLLDSEKMIVGKPITIEELIKIEKK